MKIVVAGGTGLLGSALAAQLENEGHDLTILTRRVRGPRQVAWVPDGTANGGWARTVAEADAVVNLAGASIAGGRWTDSRKALIENSRIQATRSLVAAMNAAGGTAATFLSGSAVGFYGPHGDESLTEDAAPGNDFLATVCERWEREAMEAERWIRVVRLRTGLVLDRMGGALPQIARPFYFMAGGPVGSGRQYWSWIHIADWVGIVAWALHNANVSGAINLTAPEPVTNREFATTLGRVVRRPALLPTPGLPLRIMLGEMADALLLTGQRVIPKRAQAGGYAFRYPALEPALADTLR